MTGIIILAAGSSSRLGQPKQLLVYQQQTLLQHAVNAATGVAGSSVIVVLGANYELIRPAIVNSEISVIHNPNWQLGMSSSIKVGLVEMQAHADIDAVILMLCDQPFVTAELLTQMIAKANGEREAIVACRYQDTIGTPVLFGRTYFPELLALQGEGGAKKLLYVYNEKVLTVPFPEGSIDIDTLSDYQRLTKL